MKQAFIFIFILFSFESQAQKTFSITMDADNDQFFSVAIGKKTYASSSIGHLLITGLKDSTYKLVISFPRSSYSPEAFTVQIENKDHKFLLKRVAEKQWNLQDIQTNTWVKQKMGSNQLSAPVDEANLARSRDAFKKLMAAVVNDTAILNTEIEAPPVPKKEVLVKADPPKEKSEQKNDSTTKPVLKKIDSSALVKKIPERKPADTFLKKVEPPVDIVREETRKVPDDTLVRKKSDSVITAPIRVTDIDSSISTESLKKPKTPFVESVIKLYEINKADKKEIVFITKDSIGKKDTVDIVIPIEKEPETIVPPVEIKKTEVPKPGPAIVNSDTASKKMTIINSDCRNFATEADLDKLRVKMISENRMEERVVVAKKYFKTKCFTTRQIRALTELFVSDKARYEFFDAAYPFVSDTANFKSLLDLFTDEYYIGRFKAMVRVVDSR